MNIEMMVRLQCAAACVLLIVIVDFYRKRKIRLLSTRYFSLMLWVAVVYLASDIITVYTISYMTDTLLNVIAHRVFYTLMLTVVCMVSGYVEIIGNATMVISRKEKIELVLWGLPYIICVAGIVSGKAYFVVNENGVYSTGSAVNFLYSGIAIYLVIMFIESFRYKNYINSAKRIAIRLQMVMWIASMTIQKSNPYILLSGFIIALGINILYFSIENPDANIDDSTGAYNLKGFKAAMYEECHCIGKKSFFLLVLTIDDMEILVSSIGRDRFESLMQMIVKKVSSIYHYDVYRIEENAIGCMIPEGEGYKDIYISKLTKIMSEPFEIMNTGFEVSSHITITRCPEFADKYEDVADILSFDSEYGQGKVRYVDETIKDKIKRRDILNRMIKHAVENDGFDVVFQPIYQAKSNGCISSEALVRLKDNETLGFVSPEEFVPLAEKNGYVLSLGETVFRKVCDTIIKMREQGIPIEYIEVNLSALQIINDKVTASFEQIMAEKGIEPSSINLEITETTAVESQNMLQKNMRRFKLMGCTFSMDDFGTGYSNLSNMASIGYDIVKLDKSLIWPCYDNDRTGEKASEKAKVILRNVVKMLKSLGVHIVAEGVETKEMADDLIEMGVDYLQGYYYSRPVPEEKYIEYLKNESV